MREEREMEREGSMLFCIARLRTVLYQPIRSLMLLFFDRLFINIVGLYLGGKTSTTWCHHKEPQLWIETSVIVKYFATKMTLWCYTTVDKVYYMLL